MIKKYGPKDPLNFGKHKGKRIEDIATEDPAYITWMLEQIPGFFISMEDIFNLKLVNHQVRLTQEQFQVYWKKKKNCEIQLLSFQPMLNPGYWHKLRTTPRNQRIYKGMHPMEMTYEFRNPESFFFSLPSNKSWSLCSLGVNDDAIPVIRAYGSMIESLEQKRDSDAAVLTLHSMFLEQFSMFIRTEISIDHPCFGYFAQKLIQVGLLTYDGHKS